MLELLLEQAVSFGLFWGIWLLVPLLIDVSTTLVYLLTFSFEGEQSSEMVEELKYFPYVTLVVPVHDSADTLYKCLQSLANQTYPVDCMEVICVNNGSKDESFDMFQEFHFEHPDMQVMWSSLDRAGKSIALNAGIYSGQGTYMINVDADVWLDPEAVINVVKTFEADPTIVAATGAVRVDKVLGENSNFIDMINYCEVIEYLVAFDVGRRYQNLKNSLFTLSGAFSIFRRDVLLQSFLYQERTVSEDTDLTFNIRKALGNSQGRIGFVSKSIAYVEPIESITRLYSQRVRWQRGEIEVMSTYYEKTPTIIEALQDFTGRILLSDHSIAFLRLCWTFLLPFMYFLGYPLPTIVIAMFGLFICYLVLEITTFSVAYRSSPPEYREELRRIFWVIFFMPIYRYLTYWFRLAGIILALTEARSWKVSDPVDQIICALKDEYHAVQDRIDKIWR
ncbi:MAG: putative glycosyltransferase, exosortase G system-associated [Syntrophomonas sp.]|nr:putative glycosyltransferase, exosortase G system-associated [Syntrophomonas sp.]